MKARAALLCLCCAAACASTVWIGAPVEVDNDAQAQELLRRALHGDQGHDALEAFEISGTSPSLSFVVARRWRGESVQVLSWIVRPEEARGTAFLLSRAPGWQAEMLSVFRSVNTARRQEVHRGNPFVGGVDEADTQSLGEEVALPFLLADYGHRIVGEEVLSGQTARIVESRPRRHLRAYTHLRHWILSESGASLRRVYYSGERELRRVEIDPADLKSVGPLLRSVRRVVSTADGGRNEIVLRNSNPEAALPDSLFSEQTLKTGRFPRF